jgi:hypothetical protein
MFLEANEELEEITPDVRHVPEVLITRMAIYLSWDRSLVCDGGGGEQAHPI